MAAARDRGTVRRPADGVGISDAEDRARLPRRRRAVRPAVHRPRRARAGRDQAGDSGSDRRAEAAGGTAELERGVCLMESTPQKPLAVLPATLAYADEPTR